MKKPKKATSLKYAQSYEAPIVTSAGMGYIADRIIEIAEENKVPIVQNKELANLLVNVDVGDSIPDELYDAVAKVIAYVMDLDSLIE